MTWIDAQVPYSQERYRDGWRQDCSGFVSMAWDLNRNYWTGDLNTVGTLIEYGNLEPGDMLLFHNPANPVNGSHVVIFDGWANINADFWILEQTPPHARRIRWSQTKGRNLRQYIPYRYVGVDAPTGTPLEPIVSTLPELSRGATGRPVKKIQALCNLWGTGLAEDGDFGPATDVGVRTVQAHEGIGVDGIVGPQTWTVLLTR